MTHFHEVCVVNKIMREIFLNITVLPQDQKFEFHIFILKGLVIIFPKYIYCKLHSNFIAIYVSANNVFDLGYFISGTSEALFTNQLGNFNMNL
jgi:hypothetical protein